MRQIHKKERPISYVPKPVLWALVLLLAVQVTLHHFYVTPEISVQELKAPIKKEYYLLPFLSDNIVTAKLLMLWLQAFDNQPGVSIPFQKLNYDTLTLWLADILALDEQSHYPLLSASRLYTRVNDNEKKLQMLELVKTEYLKAPNERWQWMAHCVYVAKHEIKDLSLALEYAKLLRENTRFDIAPAWVTQMEIFILEDLDEIESAKILIGGLLDSGEIKDEHELWFLKNRLSELEEKNKQ